MALRKKLTKKDKYVLPSQHADMPGMRQRDATTAANMKLPAPYGRYANGQPRPKPKKRPGDSWLA